MIHGMLKGKKNHWIGITLLVSVICFFYYKSVISEIPLSSALKSIENIENLQVQIHRDLLRYRNNQIQQYDSLNQTSARLDEQLAIIMDDKVIDSQIERSTVNRLYTSIQRQKILIEDFKTHHSILQNSLSYIFNAVSKIYSAKNLNQETVTENTTAELITLLLEYNENPQDNVAQRIYPLIDVLNNDPDSDTNSLIIHSLLIIERIPEIDSILSQFNTLFVEKQIIDIKNTISYLQHKQDEKSQIFNSLLFICSLYLIVYIIFIFLNLQKNKDHLATANNQLNHEIDKRARTEKALYKLVEMDDISSDGDEIRNLLNAICKALNVNCAYISLIDIKQKNSKIIGLVCNGTFEENFSYPLAGTPCEEVMERDRVVYDSDLKNYFPEWKIKHLSNPESYIGVSLKDKNRNIHGLLAIVHGNKIEDLTLAEGILSLATSRAIIELHKQIEFNNTQRYQHGLELIDGWIAKLITEGVNKQKFFENICLAAREITQSQLAAFPVLLTESEEYHFIAASGNKADLLEDLYLPLNDGGLCAWTILNNQTLLINDVTSDPRTKVQFREMFDVNSALQTPVTINGKPYGAISVYRNDQDFDEIDKRLITQFSQSVQMAIINMQLVNDIQSERERAEVTLHSIGDAVITTNINGEIEYMNQVAETLTAWSFKEVKNSPVQDVFRIIDIETRDPISDIVNSCLEDGIGINKSTLIMLTKNDNEKDIESSISPILNTSGNIEGIVIVFHDETERRQLENTIKHQASHDALTDLLNRNTFDYELSNHVLDAKSSDKTHVLCYLDLDRFKLVNDTAGHSAGDQCLIEIASLIHSCIRSDDIFARLGGDEFGLILQHCTVEAAVKITNNIISVINSFQFNWDGCDYSLGVSIGIIPLNQGTLSAAQAMRNADLACYTAKDQGRGQAYVYAEQDSELIRRQEESVWATRIKEALDNNRIKLYAQPIVPLNKALPRIEHYEILVRLLNEDQQLVQPGAFIPAAERYNLMSHIDKRIIEDTFRFIHESQPENREVHYSINLSGNSLNEGDLIDYIESMIERYEITPRHICFEITETAAIKNLQAVKQLIKELKEIGCQFALDDFGSGLSSFQYLKNLPVDYLKIDGSFVCDMVNNTIDHAMVAAINEVGHVMGIKTIAEYVENDQIIKRLEELNVDFAQGYGIAQPKPLAEYFGISTENEASPALKIVHNNS